MPSLRTRHAKEKTGTSPKEREKTVERVRKTHSERRGRGKNDETSRRRGDNFPDSEGAEEGNALEKLAKAITRNAPRKEQEGKEPAGPGNQNSASNATFCLKTVATRSWHSFRIRSWPGKSRDPFSHFVLTLRKRSSFLTPPMIPKQFATKSPPPVSGEIVDPEGIDPQLLILIQATENELNTDRTVIGSLPKYPSVLEQPVKPPEAINGKPNLGGLDSFAE